jgi:hypothetical protein
MQVTGAGGLSKSRLRRMHDIIWQKRTILRDAAKGAALPATTAKPLRRDEGTVSAGGHYLRNNSTRRVGSIKPHSSC